jgi:hypothetical protein
MKIHQPAQSLATEPAVFVLHTTLDWSPQRAGVLLPVYNLACAAGSKQHSIVGIIAQARYHPEAIRAWSIYSVGFRASLLAA